MICMSKTVCSQLSRKIVEDLLIVSFCFNAYSQVLPVLQIPQSGIDDTTFYNGYITRFYRDFDGNVVQIYIDNKSGRVVHLWATTMNESIGFTVRGAQGDQVKVKFGDEIAKTYKEDKVCYFEYTIEIE